MPLYDVAQPVLPYNSVNAQVILPEVYGIAINWFVNRTPLTSRLPKLPIGSLSFYATNDNYRPRSTPLNNGGTVGSTDLTFTVTDGSGIVQGDILEIDTEQILVTSVSGNVITTVASHGGRGYGGTTAATHADTTPVYLIGNARTGGEVNVAGISRLPAPVQQYVQTFQQAYSVGGSLQSATNYVSAYNSPLDRDRMMAIQHVMDDMEGTSYYGAGQALTASIKAQQQKGLRALITTNKTTSPLNSAAYKPSDFMRDGPQKCFDGGGLPSLILASTDFMTGLAVWGGAIQRINAGVNVFGTPIDMFLCSFIPGIPIVPAPLLRAGTAIVLSVPEVRMRIKRQLFDKPRGSRGDAFEGDMIMEGAIELDNEAHHAWVSGITAFAPA